MNHTFKLTDLPESERPRERLLRYGPETLSNAELLAVILRCGTKKENIITLCSNLLKKSGGLNGLLNISSDELINLHGFGSAKAAQIISISEIYRRFKSYKAGEEYKITQPKDVADFVMEEMRNLKQERLRVIMLNTKNSVLSVKDVSIGSLNASIVHPREVFCEAIKKNSASIIICHNHPSGDTMPSREDINVTHRLKECGKLIGIDLLDHIIIGDGKYISLKEKGIL
jgi:DNA repair protein RadC